MLCKQEGVKEIVKGQRGLKRDLANQEDLSEDDKPEEGVRKIVKGRRRLK